ncbi:hypothetical protein TYRP_021919 [Tyrophagus putrescentiae]|nr:hypothetical protein TYRP_021919 [Tyrophagus putrescentiae]
MKEIIKKASLLEESESSFDSQNDTNFASQTSSESSFYDKKICGNVKSLNVTGCRGFLRQKQQQKQQCPARIGRQPL